MSISTTRPTWAAVAKLCHAAQRACHALQHGAPLSECRELSYVLESALVEVDGPAEDRPTLPRIEM